MPVSTVKGPGITASSSICAPWVLPRPWVTASSSICAWALPSGRRGLHLRVRKEAQEQGASSPQPLRELGTPYLRHKTWFSSPCLGGCDGWWLSHGKQAGSAYWPRGSSMTGDGE